MKFGQAMSIFESALPESMVAPYRATLTRFQDSAPPMQSSLVHQVLARELGGAWRRDLVSFDDNPAAAASIGQVHKAVWRDGRTVAVKIQYPGAGDALRSDLKQIGRAAKLFAGWIPGIDVKPLVEELQARVEEELDYTLEADAQRRFAAAFTDDLEIVVPDVVTHTGKVLVTEWLESDRSLARLIAEGTQADRDHYGQVYVRFLFSGPARAGLLHADPHPGNFRLLPDGRVGVVDYGAVARLPGGLPRVIGNLLRAAVDDDYDAVLDGLRQAGFVKPNISVDAEALRDYLAPFVEPADRGDVPVLQKLDARTVRADQRPAPARVHDDAEDQPAPGVPAHPPGLARGDRGAVAARGRGALPGDPRGLPAGLREDLTSPPSTARRHQRPAICRRVAHRMTSRRGVLRPPATTIGGRASPRCSADAHAHTHRSTRVPPQRRMTRPR